MKPVFLLLDRSFVEVPISLGNGPGGMSTRQAGQRLADVRGCSVVVMCYRGRFVDR